jgi:hypothetical protein
MAKTFPFVISDESVVNSYGSRVMTSGIDVKQYKRNPIVLWYHKKPHIWDETNHDVEILPIGKAVKLWKEDGKLMADIEFDEEDEFASKIAGKVERGFLNMCSPGLEPVTVSDDAKYLLPGQQRATVVKSILEEISIVDVGSNKNALRLSQGKEQDINNIIPLVHSKTEIKMNEFKTKVASIVGLDPNATDDSVLEAVRGKVTLAKQANDFKSKHEALQQKLDEMNEHRIIQLVDQYQDKKFTADKRETFITLGKQSGYDTLKNVLEATADIVKPNDIITPGNDKSGHSELTFAKLREKGMKELMKFKREHKADYIRLYKAEYGVEPQMEEDEE